MELTNDFFDSYIVNLAGYLFENKCIDYLCYQHILNKKM